MDLRAFKTHKATIAWWKKSHLSGYICEAWLYHCTWTHDIWNIHLVIHHSQTTYLFIGHWLITCPYRHEQLNSFCPDRSWFPTKKLLIFILPMTKETLKILTFKQIKLSWTLRSTARGELHSDIHPFKTASR